MARGKPQKRKKGKMHLKLSKSKYKKKRPHVFRDIKHTEQYAQYKLKLDNEKKKKIAIDEEESEGEVVNDPLTLLLSTFKSKTDKISDNIAIDSEESSDEDESEMELESEFNEERNTNDLAEEISLTNGNDTR